MKIHALMMAITFLAFSGLCFQAAGQPSNERLIIRQPAQRNEPITITDIQVNGQSVSFDKTFMAGDYCMLTLAFTVRNDSDKPIAMAELDFIFRDVSRPKQPIARFDLLRYGNHTLLIRSPKSNEHVISLRPGETTEIAFSPQRFVDLTRFLSDAGFPSSVAKVEFSVGHVIFGDDTMWYAGEIARRDPKDPTEWVAVRSTSSKD
jgi:hypothetical protein